MRCSRIALGLLILLAVAACGSVPRPFSPGQKSGGLPPPGPSSALIVHPVAGTETATLDALTAQIIAGLQQKQVAAIPYEVPNRYRVIGQAVATTVAAAAAAAVAVVAAAGTSSAPTARGTSIARGRGCSA